MVESVLFGAPSTGINSGVYLRAGTAHSVTEILLFDLVIFSAANATVLCSCPLDGVADGRHPLYTEPAWGMLTESTRRIRSPAGGGV